TVNQLLGNGPPSGLPRSNKAWTALSRQRSSRDSTSRRVRLHRFRTTEVRESGDFQKLNAERNHMGCLLCGDGLLSIDHGALSRRSEPERRGGAGPVRGLLGAKASPADLFYPSNLRIMASSPAALRCDSPGTDNPEKPGQAISARARSSPSP